MEKIGSFCDTTRVLNISIMGMLVRNIRLARMRFVGLTEGPPMGCMFSVSAGPLSIGSPEPLKIRPSRSSLKATRISWPRKRTSSPVETPWPPANTCRETRSPSILLTSARDLPKRVRIWASSWYRTSVALTVITLPVIDSIRLYTWFIPAHHLLTRTPPRRKWLPGLLDTVNRFRPQPSGRHRLQIPYNSSR